MSVFARFWGRYAPNGRGRIALRAGCPLFAPFITLFVWIVQGLVWLVVGTPILAYALLMAAIGGGFARDHRQPQHKEGDEGGRSRRHRAARQPEGRHSPPALLPRHHLTYAKRFKRRNRKL